MDALQQLADKLHEEAGDLDRIDKSLSSVSGEALHEALKTGQGSEDLSEYLGQPAMGCECTQGILALIPPVYKEDDWEVRYAKKEEKPGEPDRYNDDGPGDPRAIDDGVHDWIPEKPPEGYWPSFEPQMNSRRLSSSKYTKAGDRKIAKDGSGILVAQDSSRGLRWHRLRNAAGKSLKFEGADSMIPQDELVAAVLEGLKARFSGPQRNAMFDYIPPESWDSKHEYWDEARESVPEEMVDEKTDTTKEQAEHRAPPRKSPVDEIRNRQQRNSKDRLVRDVLEGIRAQCQ